MYGKDHGLDVNAKNVQGLTALHVAAHQGQSDSIEFLVSQGADINLQGDDDHSALHLLASTARKDPSEIKDTQTLRKVGLHVCARRKNNMSYPYCKAR